MSTVSEAVEKAERKKFNKAFGRKITISMLIATGMQFWFAQLIVWGLSLYHIDSGLAGPFLIMEGVSSAGVWVVHLGMMHAVRDFQNIRS